VANTEAKERAHVATYYRPSDKHANDQDRVGIGPFAKKHPDLLQNQPTVQGIRKDLGPSSSGADLEQGTGKGGEERGVAPWWWRATTEKAPQLARKRTKTSRLSSMQLSLDLEFGNAATTQREKRP
jgi:hypothetical protein